MTNKRILSLFLVISVAIVTFSIYNSTSADGVNSQPGSVDDPAVSKSYVDEQVKLQVAAQIEKFNKNGIDVPASVGGSGTEAALTKMVLAPGETLIADTGTEIIVRTGYVTAVSNDGNGIPDVTAGKDIAVKSVIALNHLLIFPTNQRGIKADPKKTEQINVMVRGGYKVTNEADGTGKVVPTATPAATPVATSSTDATTPPVISP